MYVLKIKKEYQILFSRFYQQKKITIFPYVGELHALDDSRFEEKLINKFTIFDLGVTKVVCSQHINLKQARYINIFNVCVFQVADQNAPSRIMELLDVEVDKIYRGRGIGKQLSAVLDEIARENNIRCIIGELQNDKKDEPLKGRIKFFRENGYEVWEDERAKFSGWVIRKSFVNH